MLDPGETADLLVTYKNSGSAKAAAITFGLSSGDPQLTLNSSTASVPLLKPDSSCTLAFNVTGGNSAPVEHVYQLNGTISASNNFSMLDTLYLFSGQIVEDFETGNFNKFPWFTVGQAPWLIESGVKYEGNFSTRSGWIGDDQESKLNLIVNVLAEGPMTFYKYVSCEFDPSGNKGYDYLVFLIDGYEIARWDGVITWSKEIFWLSSGYHTISWVYHKDYSVAAGWDGCLLDFITFPLIEGALPSLDVAPLSIEETLYPGDSVTKPLVVTNPGGGILKYSVVVFDTTANKKAPLTDNLSGSYMTCGVEEFTPGQAFTWTLTVCNHSPDNEFIKHIKLDIPPGVLIEAATNFSGGSLGELVFTGTPGNGPTLNWHGEAAGGIGVLKPGDTAYAQLTGTINESFMNDVFMVYDLRGDSNGATPYHVAGQIKVKNNGLANSWVSLVNATGSLMHNQSATVLATIDATGLTPNTYKCDLIIRDLYNNKVIVPVTLHVPFPVGIEEPLPASDQIVGNFPNPFSTETKIRYELCTASAVIVEIFSQQGIRLRNWKLENQSAGNHVLAWDGKDSDGLNVLPGIYIGQLITENFKGSFKMIVIR